MSYVLTFSHAVSYNCHAQGCSAAVKNRDKELLPEVFASIDAARAWADADESEKAGEPLKAIFKVCKCARATK